MFGIDLPEGIYYVCVAVQTENLFMSPADVELAAVQDVLGICEIQGPEAGLGQVCQEDIPSFAKIGLPHLVASLEVRGRDELLRLGVTNCDHVVISNLRGDGNISGEVEMYWKWDKVIKWHQVVWHDERYVHHQD